MDRFGFVVGPGGGSGSGRRRDVSVCTVPEKLAGLAFIATSIALGTALAQNGAFIGATKMRTCLSCKGKGEVKCPVCNGASVVKTEKYAKRCQRCDALGSIPCGVCGGTGK
uniref:CR-type domain-containing protein n=1 Tax=Rhodosorus marinus TaxID=101924 RepID=A0A7S2ZUM3_9RHOD|mmetsp:Transcript_33294/g.131117  ORF Transcript_33294/g.131117 Transcript_33294/m.131117 type:complete len:111 (+) Transcript_33294:69-401(+)